MRCIECQKGKYKVTETRTYYDEIYRRRKCMLCGHIIFTSEIYDEQEEEYNREMFNKIKCIK